MLNDFLARYPEMKAIPHEQITQALEDAALEVSARVWGKLYGKGVCALAAHRLWAIGALNPEEGRSGMPAQGVTSSSAGALSVSYSAPDTGFSSGHQGLALSTYGQDYLRLQSLVGRYFLAVK